MRLTSSGSKVLPLACSPCQWALAILVSLSSSICGTRRAVREVLAWGSAGGWQTMDLQVA